MGAARAHAPAPRQGGATEPGPFAFGAEARVRDILTGAGFAAPAFEKLDLERDLAQGEGLDHAVASAMRSGPAARLFATASAETVAGATDAVRRALAPFAQGNRVPLAAAVWIVTTSAA